MTDGSTADPAGRVRPPAAARRTIRRERLHTLGFLAPFLVGFCAFFAYPLIATVYFSFTHYDQVNPPTFVGLRNWDYVLFQYPQFGTALANTLWLVVVMVTARVLFGLAIGMLITRVKTGLGTLRSLFYLPYLAPPVAATTAFVYLLNPGTGPVNQLLHRLGIPAPNWFNDPSWSKPALTLLALWGIGDLMVIFMAALLDVPTELYEAAQLDGAGAWAKFRHITLPTISPVVLFAAITGVISSMQYYTQAILAGSLASGIGASPGVLFEPGYPSGSTLTLPQLVYSLGFQHYNTGAACVVALLLFALAMAFTLLLLRRGSGFLTEEGR
ncbi:sugar ABC transporter permease [Kitasatospora nipponensis]|uniref:Sugar ABC transporter permease n=1 Tax=Kitasatospora nipponensis TaxID=258049 RepID=A0ABN1VWJ2_9ACTN